MRGDNSFKADRMISSAGSPPHARGQPMGEECRTGGSRFTPACAGTTVHPLGVGAEASVHPRMRGDNYPWRRLERASSGSPPHARGQRSKKTREEFLLRFTPACAGTTTVAKSGWRLHSVHPRMRGDNRSAGLTVSAHDGSPPHARGQPELCLQVAELVRFTPACAGTTRLSGAAVRPRTVHPRMRGDNPVFGRRAISSPGSPPHARGQLSRFGG